MNASLILVLVCLALSSGCRPQETLAKAVPEEPDRTSSIGSTNLSALASTNSVPPPQVPEDLPTLARELVLLAHNQFGDGVLTNFIANAREPFELDAGQIVYLRDVGISSEVIEFLLTHQQELRPVSSEDSDSKSTASAVAQPTAPTATVPAAPATVDVPSQSSNGLEFAPGTPANVPPPQVGPAQSVATEAAPPVVNNFNFFYDSLAPYGSWVTVPSYGYVWRPTCAVVSPGWRPYWNNGSWVWSDCGWYWNSYYSWGWAPFHYGNWFNAPGYGWCWAPGSTWGPSWVTFRYSGGYCGWAPLPPGCAWNAGVGLTWAGSGVGVGFGFGYSAANYCWTPTGYFAAPNCAQYGVVGAASHQIYQNSSVINNYVVGNNNTIINNGIDPTQIQKHSRSEIRKVQLADVGSPGALRSTSTAISRPGQSGSLAVYRPAVGSSPAPARTSATSRSDPNHSLTSRYSDANSPRPSLPRRASSPGQVQDGSSRINIPAGSPNPRGSAVQLHNGSGRGPSPGTGGSGIPSRGGLDGTPTRPGVPAGTPIVRTTPNPAVESPGTSTSSGATRLQPRKSISTATPAFPNQLNRTVTPENSRIPASQNNASQRVAATSQGPARIPPSNSQGNYSPRPASSSARIPVQRPTPAAVQSYQQAPRSFSPAPVQTYQQAPRSFSPAPASRPQFAPGGGASVPAARAGRPIP